jgi:hypothetical protein
MTMILSIGSALNSYRKKGIGWALSSAKPQQSPRKDLRKKANKMHDKRCRKFVGKSTNVSPFCGMSVSLLSSKMRQI